MLDKAWVLVRTWQIVMKTSDLSLWILNLDLYIHITPRKPCQIKKNWETNCFMKNVSPSYSTKNKLSKTTDIIKRDIEHTEALTWLGNDWIRIHGTIKQNLVSPKIAIKQFCFLLHTGYPVSTGVGLHAQKRAARVLLCKDLLQGTFALSSHQRA